VVEGTATAVDFICKSDSKKPIDECRFTVPGFASEIKIFGGLNNTKYGFVGEGFSKGECGLRLHSVFRNNTGKIRCNLILNDDAFSKQVVEFNLTVLYPIEKLEIGSNNNFYEYKENDQMEFTCSAEGGFPTPTLSLSIGMDF
jgi:hypothetical protein